VTPVTQKNNHQQGKLSFMQLTKHRIVNVDLTATEDRLINALRSGSWADLPYQTEEEQQDGLEGGFTQEDLDSEVESIKTARAEIIARFLTLIGKGTTQTAGASGTITRHPNAPDLLERI
jgi:hypothetical protein